MKESMLAAVYRDGSIQLRELARPRPDKGEALLQVEAAAICATDLKIWQKGHRNIPPGAETILGHEVVGRIVALGEGVRGELLHQRVVVAPNVGCGVCPPCQKGRDSLCSRYIAFGVGLNGGFAQYMLITSTALKRSCLVEVPEEVDAKMAALAEAAACCLSGLQACSLQQGESVLILGAGPMGILTQIIAQAMGAGRVFAADFRESRRSTAAALGAVAVFNPLDDSFLEKISAATSGLGADVVMVTAPVAAAQKQGIMAAAVGGRVNLFAGVAPEDRIEEFPGNLIHYRGLNVLGTTGATPVEMNAVVSMMAGKRLQKLAEVITAVYPLSAIDNALENARQGSGLKVILIPDSANKGGRPGD